MSASRTVAIVGVGIMGSRLAARFIEAGFSVRGYDPDPATMSALAAMGGVATGSPAEAAEGSWAAVLSLMTTDISREVSLGAGGIHECENPPGFVFDTTTGRPADSVEIGERLSTMGIEFADMTLSGNAAMAARGELTVMLGGSDAAFAAARPIIEAIGVSGHHVGPVGSGALAKLVVNHVLAINRASLAEGLVAAEAAGIDLERMLDVLKAGAAYSKAMDLWGDRMVAG